jgi:hypothetical protein
MVDPTTSERDDIVGIEAHIDDVFSVRQLHDAADW